VLPGQQELEDDLRNHWTGVPHGQERLRLIYRLLGFARRKGCRVTLLSGDVHVGAGGIVKSERQAVNDCGANAINQLASSCIEHHPASRYSS